MELKLGRFLVHDCPAESVRGGIIGEIYLPPEPTPEGSRRWCCEFCGLDETEN